jgi:hypothetical protein
MVVCGVPFAIRTFRQTPFYFACRLHCANFG